MSPSQQKLAYISRRNVERVVALVENQLDLLQMMAGERRVARRLVDLDALARGIPREGFEAAVDTPGTPHYAFTDPDHLTAIIECLLGFGPPNAGRSLRLQCDGNGWYTVDVSVEYLESEHRAADAPPSDPSPALDFEYRAYQAMIERLGGQVVMEKHADRKWARIRLPRHPGFDRRKDFLNTIRRVRSFAEERGCDVRFLRCDLDLVGDGDFLSADDPSSGDFLHRVGSVLSDGDAVVRGKTHGTLYLVLIDRSDYELEHVRTFLSAHRDGLFVWKPQTIVPDVDEIGLVVRELERV